jgi:hypothetical protein
MGAAANATDYLAEHHSRVRPGELLIAGLLIVLVGWIGSAVARLDYLALLIHRNAGGRMS